MAVTVKKVVLYRRDIENKPGTLAETLKPFAKNSINLQLIMGYTMGPQGPGAVEVFPVTDAKSEAAAKEAGLKPSKDTHCLLVEGEDRPGLGHEITQAIGAEGVNLHFVMLFALSGKFTGVFGVGTEAEATAAAKVIEKVGALAHHH